MICDYDSILAIKTVPICLKEMTPRRATLVHLIYAPTAKMHGVGDILLYLCSCMILSKGAIRIMKNLYSTNNFMLY